MNTDWHTAALPSQFSRPRHPIQNASEKTEKKSKLHGCQNHPAHPGMQTQASVTPAVSAPDTLLPVAGRALAVCSPSLPPRSLPQSLPLSKACLCNGFHDKMAVRGGSS